MEKLIYVICLIFVLRTISSQINTRCTTPNQLDGICINIQRCILLDTMFKDPNRNDTAKNLLSKSFCGHEGTYPKVCCPTSSDYETVWSSKLPSRKKCGIPSTTKVKIVGGTPSELGAWPWVAALGYKYIYKPNNDHEFLCGGALISDRYVVTAAHCTIGSALKNKILDIVRLGDLDLDPTKNDEATPINYAVTRILRHTEYNASNFTNDIALLKLNSSVAFTELIKPICLPVMSKMRQNMFVKYQLYVAGWGTQGFRGPSSSALLEVQVPVRENKECKELYSKQPNIIDERVLCAGAILEVL
ncbi:Hypothetical protein CINCED_3A012542 [Cinara cedri]|uniref:CLIP domain-containing serine protease n=1 Tax=Cinara cedri TaxID=506608 RepID=A0A5E4N484_9HEMI|nr:Hypothetical protein CINCED_3A012542 [Cinara cedri]